MRLYYKFPRSWINENYEGKKVLPRLDAVINEMANKTKYYLYDQIYKESNKGRTKCVRIYNSTSPGDSNLESNSIRPNTCNSNDAGEFYLFYYFYFIISLIIINYFFFLIFLI
ncbi:hypothetical protein Glove_91g46 [Diversispora epigaea]|uniref:Uncharacterized protein n=1 Tax=Diversispora epigaea TaxID=1348612 RepID=A0A397J9Y1_9GLOM|nr:hypothetical protein Glove_91g46 [Diversispora epigaea]